MKIGILTLPLHTNYGGLLQAYALQTALTKMGHEAWNVDRQFKAQPVWIKILSVIKRSILKVCLRKDIRVRIWPTAKEENLIAGEMDRFVNENIRSTERIDSLNGFSVLRKYGFDAWVVGSDQVWRQEYTPCISNYFLDFTGKENKMKRIAYAASFGVDYWGYTSEETAKLAELAKRFDFISVREKSGIALCKEHLGMEATHLPDPTLLLPKEEYIRLIEKDAIPESNGSLMYYMLDPSSTKSECVRLVAEELGLKPFTVFPSAGFAETGKDKIDLCIFPPVTKWLRGFMDASYVVTDSFHGTVFAIIFNKPFIAIGNAERGLSRFVSLLELFGLEDRLIIYPENLTKETIQAPIDFESVNARLKSERIRVTNLIEKILNG